MAAIVDAFFPFAKAPRTKGGPQAPSFFLEAEVAKEKGSMHSLGLTLWAFGITPPRVHCVSPKKPDAAIKLAKEAPERHKSLKNIVYFHCFWPSRLFGPRGRQDGPRGPTHCLRGPQDGPRGPQDRPKTAQEALKRSPGRPKKAPRRPKSRPRRPKRAPRRAQKGGPN